MSLAMPPALETPAPPCRHRRLALWPRLERAGWFDGALFLLALVTYFQFRDYQLFSHRGNLVRFEPTKLGALCASILLTWGMLAAGALAPLARRPVARRGELPRGAGLWLAGYGMMALVWLVVLFNIDPDALWAFWHLARLNPQEAVAIATLAPLILAPGWRRLFRAGRLAWLLRRRRQAPASGARWRRGIFLLALGLYAWTLTDYAIMSDGWGIMFFGASSHPLFANGYREPGCMMFLQLAVHGLRPFGLNTCQAIQFVNFLATLGTLAFLGRMLSLLRLSCNQRRTGWLLVFSSLGVMQMLMGRVELYALVQLGLTATVVGSLAALEPGRSPMWLTLAFALGLAGHLSLIFIFPAVLLALWLRAQPWPGERPSGLRWRKLGQGWAHLWGWGLLIHLPLWGLLMMHLDDPTPLGLVRAVAGSLNTGAENETFIGSTTSSLVGQLAKLFQPDNDFKMVQLLFYLAGGAAMAMALAALARPLGWRGTPVREPLARRRQAVLLTAWLGFATYAFTWHADWTWMEDWDLFSGLACVTVMLAIGWLMPGPGRIRLPLAFVRQICLFALALTLTQHYFYHTRASYLGPMNKIVLDPKDGRLFQNYQIEHGHPYGEWYLNENGTVVVKHFADPSELEVKDGGPAEPPKGRP